MPNVSIYLKNDIYEQLKAVCKEQNCNLSNLIESYIVQTPPEADNIVEATKKADIIEDEDKNDDNDEEVKFEDEGE
jgi:hypothetical protein